MRWPACPFVLRLHPAIVIVEFGGNDGLRGLPVDQTRSNLDQVLTGLEKAQVKIVLAGITLPPDYGPDYIRSFDQIFRDLAAQAPRGLCAHALQESGPCSRNDPGRRHPSHRQRFRDHRRHAFPRAQAVAAQVNLSPLHARDSNSRDRSRLLVIC